MTAVHALQIKDAGFARLVTGLAGVSGLATLDLSRCWLGSEGAVIVAGFVDRSAGLQSLELASNFLSTNQAGAYDDSGIKALLSRR